MPAYNILLMGASYGSLLASKLLFGGHSIHLVCLPAEADLINAEGFKVTLPVRGRNDPVLLESRKLPGKVTAGRATGVDPSKYDLVGLCMQEPQYRSPGVRELLDAVGKSRVPCMSIMNMPPLPYIKRIPGLDYKALEPAYTDPRVWDSVDPKKITLNSPDPQAIRPPDGKANELLVTLPTNFKCAQFEDDKDTQIIRNLEKDVDAARFDTPEGKIELPVKLQGLRLDLGAARQVVDAARRQLSLHHQRRHAHRAGSGAFQHRGVALGLQLRVRSLRQARRQARRISCRSRNTPPRRNAVASGFRRARAAKRRAQHRTRRQAGAADRQAEGPEPSGDRRPGRAGRRAARRESQEGGGLTPAGRAIRKLCTQTDFGPPRGCPLRRLWFLES